MHEPHEFGALDPVNVLANLLIVVGYVIVPATVLRHLPLTTNVRVAGAFFFTTCAITHLAMAFGTQHHPLMVANHVVQAAAVIWFVLGFWRLLRHANKRRVGRHAAPVPVPSKEHDQ